VSFKVTAGTPGAGELVIKDGVFEGPASSTTPKIGFTTQGYEWTAAVYYAVVAGGSAAPGYSAYTGGLGELGAQKHEGKQIYLGTAGGNYDVYVILMKGGKVSEPVVINTANGGVNVDWEWGPRGKFVAVNGINQAAYSANGIDWTTAAEIPDGAGWYDITYGDGKFVAIYLDQVACSTDGATWTVAPMPSTTAYPPASPASACWSIVTYGAGKFVAIDTYPTAYYPKRSAYSTDGVTWTVGENLPSSDTGWAGVTYGDGKFVAISRGRKIAAYSTDGAHWEQTTLPGDYYETEWSSVTYGDGKFVAITWYGGPNKPGLAVYSEDGINWTETSLPMSANWYDVTFGDGRFVAICNSGTAAYSDDGVNWTLVSKSLPRPHHDKFYYSVTYGDGKFVAVGGEQTAYSTDGLNWTRVPQPNTFSRVAYGE
jgi:hypothetical protein